MARRSSGGLRDGVWTPERIAEDLHLRRAALSSDLARRRWGRGLSAGTRDEIVCDAIADVALSSRSIEGEQHLLGAFWRAVGLRVLHHWEGRHLTRLGSRRRVALDDALSGDEGDEVFEWVEQIERVRQAADWLVDLTPRERRVVTVMATRRVGAVPAARLLGLELGEVRSAARSAQGKLDRLAAIARAGRMCGYRRVAIVAAIDGKASSEQARAARAHLSACTTCRHTYGQLPAAHRRGAAAMMVGVSLGRTRAPLRRRFRENALHARNREGRLRRAGHRRARRE
jgi:hypothetical protein